ncbi:hypothetical protein E2C01_076859 [Portunus trituberculatus]|uniref:Uncharacterized protein n=1 Tax=Portunus trituberculatus TaxID=210409 RepID=A0A5B7ICV7_PORTR|nr:hypothetical protein [Portunus trituberculatus]
MICVADPNLENDMKLQPLNKYRGTFAEGSLEDQVDSTRSNVLGQSNSDHWIPEHKLISPRSHANAIPQVPEEENFVLGVLGRQHLVEYSMIGHWPSHLHGPENT